MDFNSSCRTAALLASAAQNVPASSRHWSSTSAAYPGARAAPINVLPSELLLDIFSFVKYRDPMVNQDVVDLSHVCRRWRALVTSAPDLWIDVWMDDASLAQTCLERSQALPIVVHFPLDIRRISYDRAFEILKPHVHRVQELAVSASDVGDLLEFAYVFDIGMPSLERLSLRLELNESEDDEVLEDLEGFPPHFMGHFPNLRELTLVNFPETVVQEPLPHLHTLRLMGTLPDLDVLVELLGYCSTITRLYLINEKVWCMDHAPAQLGFPLIELPRLNKLTITDGPLRSCVNVLSCLQFPPSTLLRISSLVYPQHGNDLRPDTRLCNTDNLSYVAIDWLSKRELYIRGWRTSAGDRGDPHMELTIHTASKDLASPLLPHWPIDLSQVCALDLNAAGNTFQCEPAGLSPFRNLRALRLLRPSTECVKSLALALQVVVRADQTNGVAGGTRLKPAFLPSLTTVEIRNFLWLDDLAPYLQAAAACRERHMGADRFRIDFSEVQTWEQPGVVLDSVRCGRVTAMRGVEWADPPSPHAVST